VQVELSCRFATDYCQLQFHGPAIEALGLRDSSPKYRVRAHQPRQSVELLFSALRCADGERITAMLDLITTALRPGT
jgi:hypothetical protein